MGIFEAAKVEIDKVFSEDDKLDRLLHRAAAEPGRRPEFIDCLLQSRVWVIGECEPDNGQLMLNEIRNSEGHTVIPFFSSPAAADLLDIDIPNLVGLPARALFELTRGASLLLNPGSDIGKEFLPSEVAELLEHGAVRPFATRVLARDTPIQVAEPPATAVALIDALTTLFSRHEGIRTAWLALMHEEGSERPPSLLLALEATQPVEQAMGEVGLVAFDTAPTDMAVDLIVLGESNEGLADLLRRKIRPFYESHWGARLRDTVFPVAGRA